MKFLSSLFISIFIYIVSFAQTDTLLNVDFNNCTLPNGWNVQVEGEQYLYDIGTYQHDSLTAFNSTIDSCMFYFDDDKLGNNSQSNWSAQVITPTFDAAYYTNIYLAVDVFFRNYDGKDFFRVLVFNGFEYIEIDRFQGQDYTGTTFDTYVSKSYDLTPYINCDLSVIFEYNDGGGWGWYCGFDNVVLTGVGSNQANIQNYNFDGCNNEGWSSQSLSGSLNWNFNNTYSINGTCNANITNANTTTLDKTQLISPSFSTLGVERLFLDYRLRANLPSGNYAYLKTLIVTGNDTIVLQNYQRVGGINETISLNITDYKHPNTQIVFEYSNNENGNSAWVALDNIEIYGIGNIPNETCNDALPLYPNAPCEMGCTIGAYFEKSLPSCYVENKSAVWYQFTATQNDMTIEVASDFNDILTVFAGTCTSLNEVFCSNEDAFGFGGEALSLTGLNVGDTYYVRISGADCTYGKPEGTFCINLIEGINTPTLPPNDDCTGAITLTTTAGDMGSNCINGENLSATFSNLIPSCNQNAKADIWYNFQATNSDSIFISTQASFAEVITIYEGNCGNLTEVTCADYGHHLILSNLTVGNDYYLQIAGAFATLRGEICVSMSDNCTGSPSLEIEGTDAFNVSIFFFDLGGNWQANFPVGVNNVTITSEDACGNELIHTLTVTVTDDTPPTIVCPTMPSGNCDISEVPPYMDGAAGASAFENDGGTLNDFCQVDLSTFVYLGQTASTTTCPITYTRTYQVSDFSGNTASCTQTIEIDDNIPPVITPPANATVECDADSSPAATGMATATDNCTASAPVITFSDVSDLSGCGGYTGTITRTWTATDACGNAVSTDQIITIEDNTGPVMPTTCADITVNLDGTGAYTLSTADMMTITAGVSDACAGLGALTYAADITAFDCFNPAAPVLVTLTVTDPCTNESMCTANVTVVETIAPIAACNDITIELDATGNYSLNMADMDAITLGTTDNCVDFTSMFSDEDFDCADAAAPVTITVTYTDNSSNSSNCTADITVEDNTDPLAVCPGTPIVLGLDASGSVTLAADALAGNSTDACGLDTETSPEVTYGCADVGVQMVMLTATDVNGNVGTAMCSVTIEDNVDPIAVCASLPPVILELDATGSVTLAADFFVDGSSTDACGIDTETSPETIYDCDDIGTQMVMLTATDMNGNVGTTMCSVTVEDNMLPVSVTCPADFDMTITDPNVCTLDATATLDFSDNCTSAASLIITTTAVNDNNGVITTTGPVSTVYNAGTDMFDFNGTDLKAGDNIITVVADDGNGNTVTCEFTITIFDVFGPNINSCPTDIVVTAPAGDCQMPISWTPPAISDPCDVFTFTASHNPNDLFDVGTTTVVTYTAMDASGNTAECTFNVTVNGSCSDIDIVPAITLLPGTVVGNSIMGGILKVIEIGGQDTDGSPISVVIPNDPRLTFTWQSGMTDVGGIPVDNSIWDYDGTTYPGFHVWTTNASFSHIPADDEVVFGFLGNFDSQGSDGTSTFTMTIGPGGGGEVVTNNNSTVEVVVFIAN